MILKYGKPLSSGNGLPFRVQALQVARILEVRGKSISFAHHASLCYFRVGIVGALLAGFPFGKALFTVGSLIIESVLWSLLGAVILWATCPSWAQSAQRRRERRV